MNALSPLRLQASLLLVGVVLGAGGGWLLAKRERGAGASPKTTGPIVARWKGGHLPLATLENRLDELGQGATAPERRRAMAIELMDNELFAEEARARGLLDDEQVAAQVKELLARRLIQKEFDENEARKKIDRAEVERYYAEHGAEFNHPERVHIRHLFVVVPPEDGKARAQARRDLEKLRADLLAKNPAPPNPFEGLDGKPLGTGRPPLRIGLEDLGLLSRPDMEARLGAAFADEAWLLVRRGELSKVLETPRGLSIATVEGRSAAAETSLEKAEASIRSRLWYARRAAELASFAADLKKSRELVVDEPLLEQAVTPNSAAKAPTP